MNKMNKHAYELMTVQAKTNSRTKNRLLGVAGLLVLTTALAIGGLLGLFPGNTQATDNSPQVQQLAVTPSGFTRLAEKAGPAVVNIRTERTIKGGGPVFRHFFGGPSNPFEEFFRGNGRMPRNYKQQSLGTGFIIDPKGYIVTNNHVVEDADEIQVKLKSGQTLDATVKGRDPNTDLALIKVKADHDLPYLTLGDSDQVKVGQWVLAIGNPFGLEHTVTAGIVSAKGRVIGSGPYDDFIQTDASINPGNSGGPLLDMNGNVVGINTAIVAQGQGIGFAVPASMAKTVVEQLEKEGSVTRGWIGVSIQDLSDEMAQYYKVPENKGVLVGQAFEGDPAYEAGIRSGDIILSVNGEDVENTRDLTSLVAKSPVGETAKIKVMRKGETQTFEVKVARRDDSKAAPASKVETQSLGLTVSKVTPEIARKLDIPQNRGVVVTDVEQDSLAEKAEVKTGDVVLEVNHQPVNSPDEFKQAVEKSEKDASIRMLVQRQGMGFALITIQP